MCKALQTTKHIYTDNISFVCAGNYISAYASEDKKAGWDADKADISKNMFNTSVNTLLTFRYNVFSSFFNN